MAWKYVQILNQGVIVSMPIVIKQKVLHSLTSSLAYQRLYCEGVSDRHDAVVHVVLVVQHVRVGMKRFPDTVSAWPESNTNKSGDGEHAGQHEKTTTPYQSSDPVTRTPTKAHEGGHCGTSLQISTF